MKNEKTIVLITLVLLFIVLGCSRGSTTRSDFTSDANTNPAGNSNTATVKTESQIAAEKESNRRLWIDSKQSEFTNAAVVFEADQTAVYQGPRGRL